MTNQDRFSNGGDERQDVSLNESGVQSGDRACDSKAEGEEPSSCDFGCCVMGGRGGKLRVALLVVLAVVVVVLLVRGFSAAG